MQMKKNTALQKYLIHRYMVIAWFKAMAISEVSISCLHFSFRIKVYSNTMISTYHKFNVDSTLKFQS